MMQESPKMRERKIEFKSNREHEPLRASEKKAAEVEVGVTTDIKQMVIQN